MPARIGSWRRSWVTAALSVGVVVAAGSVAGPTAAGQQAEDEAVGHGTAKATAKIANIAPGVGELDLAIQSGTAIADQTNLIGQAQAQSLDLGLIGTSLTAEGCGDAVLSADQLPQPVRVDNRQGDASESREEVPLGPIGALRLSSSADAVPSASAQAEGLGVDIPGVLDIGIGRSRAETEYLPGVGREARASVDVAINIAGVIELNAMSWQARHRTGTERLVEGSFTIGAGTLGGIPLPVDGPTAAQDAINGFLEFTGLSVHLPRVVEFTEPTDLIRVTPLRITIDDSELGGLVVGPGLNASREQREQLFNEIAAAVCEAKAALLVADVGIAVAAGTGFLSIEIGGVEASSGEFEVGDAIGIPEVATVAPPSSAEPPPTPAPAPQSSPVVTSPSSVSTAAPPTEATAPEPTANLGPLETVCESVHPFDWPSCSQGAAPTAGLVGLLATGGMVTLDWRRQRLIEGGPTT